MNIQRIKYRVSNFAQHPRLLRCKSIHLTCQTAPSTAHPSQSPDLLHTLVTLYDAEPSYLKVERSYLGPQEGWGLVAVDDIAPSEVILSIPLEHAITSEGASSEDEWSIHMIGQVLNYKLSGTQSDTKMFPDWHESLPSTVLLPWLYWTDEQIHELQDQDTINEIYFLRDRVFNQAIDRYQLQHTVADIAHALSLVHSRSFIINERKIHAWVPGIDLCNHSFTKCTARVQCTYSKEHCQGLTALEEVAPVATTQLTSTSQSTFDLVADEAGIKKGEQVTISYGSWPNDVTLLFFGFVPDGWCDETENEESHRHQNPHDALVIFTTEREIEECIDRMIGSCCNDKKINNQKEDDEDEDEDAAMTSRLVVTAQGLDARLLPAVETAIRKKFGAHVHDTDDSYQRSMISVHSVLLHRCNELIALYDTTLEEDLEQLRRLAHRINSQSSQTEDNSSKEILSTAIRYRMSKKRILQSFQSSLLNRN